MKSDAVKFFKWMNETYYEGFNGWIPKGMPSRKAGDTVEEMYKKFKKLTTKQK